VSGGLLSRAAEAGGGKASSWKLAIGNGIGKWQMANGNWLLVLGIW
jgi:hypothetical protein